MCQADWANDEDGTNKVDAITESHGLCKSQCYSLWPPRIILSSIFEQCLQGSAEY
jgi:hypothetical protein